MPEKHLIIGTAGHIDHGKTALVKALTGTDTDRLKEEKKRGITIELGFAYTDLSDDLTISFIDVPGHEGFIKNMLAGIGGIDLALLIVAADESVMPQTVEHFNICRLMGIKRGIVVITKSDLAGELVEMVEMEVQEMVEGSFLEDSPVVKVDSISGTGIDELKKIILSEAETIRSREAEGAYLLHVDRIFTMKGFGSVVTGTSYRGSAEKGQTLDLLPPGKQGRIRSIQVHEMDVECTRAGQRTALNLQDLDLEDIERGMTLVEPGVYRAGDLLDVMLEMTGNSPIPLKNNDRVRFHHGAVETFGRLRLMDGKTMEKGSSGPAQIRLESEIVAVCGDRFILRRYSPATTIAGGVIVDNLPLRKGKFNDDALRRLKELPGADIDQHVNYFCLRAEKNGVPAGDLTARFGLRESEIVELLARNSDVVFLGENPKVLFQNSAVKEIENLITDNLKSYHSRNPLKEGLSKKEIKNSIYSYGRDRVFDSILERLTGDGKIRQAKDVVALSTHKISFSEDETRLKKEVEALFLKGALTPPAVNEVVNSKGQESRNILNLLVRDEVLVKLDEELVFHRTPLEKLKSDICALGSTMDMISISDFKDITGLSRKYSIPLLEYLDREKITIRVEGGRKIRKK